MEKFSIDLQRHAGASDIILGEGVFSIGGVDIALTRGGGKFAIEREYRQIEADGDFGPVKGRIRKIKSVAKLVLNALELLPANLSKFYPAVSLDTAGAGVNILTASDDVVDGDYNTVTFTGKTKAGKQVVITLDNAINLENIEWSLVDKDEVVPELTFTSTYTDDDRTTEPWQIEFAKGTVYTVTFTVSDSGGVVSGALVRFYNRTVTTNASGVAAFANVEVGNNQEFSIVKGGYETYEGAVDVDGNEAVAVTIVEL